MCVCVGGGGGRRINRQNITEDANNTGFLGMASLSSSREEFTL